MKKLFLSLFMLATSFGCANDTHQGINKVSLQTTKSEIMSELQKIEKELNDMITQYGNLCIVPIKKANELLCCTIIKEHIKKVSTFILSLIKKGKSLLDAARESHKIDFFSAQQTEEMPKIFEDISKKYEEEADKIFQQMLKKCRDNDLPQTQCTMLHTSQCDLVNAFIVICSGKAVLDTILTEIEIEIQHC